MYNFSEYGFIMVKKGDLIIKNVIAGNIWGKYSLELWKNYINQISENSTVIDVGAYTGIYSLLASSLRNDIKILAIEPMSNNFLRLKENIKINGFKNIEAIRAALGDEDKKGFLLVNNSTSHPSASSLKEHEKRNTIKKEEIKILKGESLIDKESIVELIKIDVEKTEPQVIKGFFDLIKRHHPILFVEALTNHDLDEIMELCKQYGYNTFLQILEEEEKTKQIQYSSDYIVGTGRNFIIKKKD